MSPQIDMKYITNLASRRASECTSPSTATSSPRLVEGIADTVNVELELENDALLYIEGGASG